MANETYCATSIQAAADALIGAGTDRLAVLDALMTTAIRIAREDPRDSELVHLIDAAQFLLETVEIHRGKPNNVIDWRK